MTVRANNATANPKLREKGMFRRLAIMRLQGKPGMGNRYKSPATDLYHFERMGYYPGSGVFRKLPMVDRRQKSAGTHHIGLSTVRFFAGDLSRRTMLFVIIPLIVIFFFGSLAVAVALLPQAYDWRMKSISQLLYPRVNPQFHFIPATGIALAGMLLLPFAGYIKRRLGIDSPVVRAGSAFFAGGAICVILASLINSHPLHGRATIPQLHEVLGRVGGIGLAVGMLTFEFYALWRFCRTGDGLLSRRLIFWWSVITWPAIVLFVFRLIIGAHFQVLESFTRSLKQSALWHLGFWEWIGSVLVIMFLVVSAWFLPKTDRDGATG
jgi:hypothetical protein